VRYFLTVAEKVTGPQKKSSSRMKSFKTGRFGFAYTIFLKKTRARIGTGILLFFLVVLIVGPFVYPYSPYDITGAKNQAPSLAHLFGTDYSGKDVLSQVIYGAYPSLLAGIVSALGGTILGLFLGVMAGYFSRAESTISAASDVVITFPAIPLLVLIGMLYPQIDQLLILALILILWPVAARAIRSQVLSVKNRPYVEAAKASGMSDWEIILKIIIPEVLSIAFAWFVLSVATAIIILVALEFLGVGSPEVVSWGSIFYWAQQFAFYNGDWWWILAPGVCITLVTAAFAMLGFSVEEAMNPRLMK
jgi:peptide/nickel transport system permease protein